MSTTVIDQPSDTRSDEICRLYTVDGLTMQEIGDLYEVSRERVRQILTRKGIRKQDRPSRPTSCRDEFLGVNISDDVKSALRTEATKRGISMSAMTSEVIKDMLISCGYDVQNAE